MKLRSLSALAVLILSVIALSAPAFADGHGKSEKSSRATAPGQSGPSGKHEPSSEDRAKMADAHQRMAECLRSDRPMKECRGEMKSAHGSLGHGLRCEHGESCPHGASCPHGDTCDGSCQHHGKHDGKHGDAHGAMSTQGAKDTGTKQVDVVEPANKKKK